MNSSWRRTLCLLTVAGCALATGESAHWWAVGHVAHYTGTNPPSLDCLSCHMRGNGGTLRDRMTAVHYVTPLDVAVSPDGGTLYVTATGTGNLLVADARQRRITGSIPAGRRPYAVTLSADGATAYVTDHDGDVARVIDTASRRVTAELPTGFAPAGIALAAGGLVVANTLGGDLSVIPSTDGNPELRLDAGRSPFAVAGEAGGRRALVTSLLAPPAGPDRPPAAELTELDWTAGAGATGRPDAPLLRRHRVADAHLLEGVAFVPGRPEALVTLVRPRNMIPALQVERGWMMTSGIGVLLLETGELAQLPLDEPERFFADPSDVAVTPDGRLAFVSHGGSDVVTAIDLEGVRAVLAELRAAGRPLDDRADRLATSERYVLARIPVGSNPRGLAVSPDGTRLYVAERLDDTIGVIDITSLRRIGSIDLGGPGVTTTLRLGEKVFHSAKATLQGQFSCRSCHPENHVDGLQYDFEGDGLGRNLVDNRSLLGIRGTAPFKWNGKNTSVYMQCGIRFARFLTRSQPFPFDEQVALAAYIQSLEPPRNRHRASDGSLTEAQQRGRDIFSRSVRRDGKPIRLQDRCGTCHPGALGTDRQHHDVGSASAWDSEKAFDTPHLTNVWMGAPYLHDGKASTLEEIWTVYSPGDEHGITSDLGKGGLNDLIEYLRTL
jgi:YVTN family beta-propeller protein